jgi:hypothetical protein
MQAHPCPAGLGVHVFDAHGDGCADAGEGVGEQGNNGPMENSIEDEYMFVGSNNHGARMILDSRGGTIVTFAQNPSKTRIRAAAYKPGFGCFGQQ